MKYQMTKNIFFVLVLALTALLLAVVSAPAQASELTSITTGFQLKNLDESSQASIVLTFYRRDGSVEASVPDTIEAGSSNTYFPLPSEVSAGFNGSAVISSDREVAAITNVIGDGTQNSSYSGFSAGSNNVSLPLTMKNAFDNDTWFNVQNAGSAATDVTVSYAGTACTETATIQPGAATLFDQAVNTCLPDGYINSAVITTADTSDSIVATVLQVTPTGLFAYNGFAAGSVAPVMPLVAFNNFGFHTGMQIQNTGGVATNVTVTYNPTLGGTQCTEQKTIQPGEGQIFGLYAFSLSGPAGTNTCNFGEAFVGAAQVTSNSASQDLTAIVNQTDFISKSSAYSAMDPDSATDTIVMPLIMNAFNYFTGFNILNVGTSSATVTCTFSDSTQTIVQTVASGSALTAVQNSSGFDGYVGGGKCTAGSGGLLLGVVNQLSLSLNGDQQLTHEALNE